MADSGLHAVRELFAVRRDERPAALAALLVSAVLQLIANWRYIPLFADYDEQSWHRFQANFHLSGFDPLTYVILTDWQLAYDELRHPLLAFLLYPFYLVNHGLLQLTGANFAPLIMSVLLVFCATYACIFLLRTLRQVIGLPKADALLLVALFFSFAYILVAVIVPDHFCLSLFLLTLCLWLSGRKMQQGRPFTVGQAALLFVLTAGVTLSNGAVVLLCVWFVNGRRFWHLRPLLLQAVVPSVLLVAFALAMNDSLAHVGSQKAVAKQMAWTRLKDSRSAIVAENLFGESLQLHRRYLLRDVLVERPVVVPYTWPAQYGVEAALLLLFAVGVWCGRRSRYLWLLLAVLGFNVVLHVVLAFAITEVYIMAAHWAFVIPLAMGYAFRAAPRPQLIMLRALVAVLAAWLWGYHLYQIVRYLSWPLR
ncbi:hypothetical protein SAMN04487825_10845 [Prevotella sp. kh1p2]|nr:hypothetical protein SAMN04487825_10845 [Prevotella sp. kh1p2]SNU11184.1 hypothetical protein SAMN06298210_10845 [Prevotellaceae bacterium KH2P17]